MSDSDVEEVQATHREWREKAAALVRGMGGRATPRDVHRRLGLFGYVQGTRWLLDHMIEHGMGRWETKPTGARGGRPTKVFVLATDKTNASGLNISD